jgi:inositol oxygenase
MEKGTEKRNYNEASHQVQQFYYEQHTKLTYQKALSLNRMFMEAPKRAYSVKELLTICDHIFDPSDPDISLSQTEHAYQTAQAAMNMHLPIEFAVIGLIHDLGKAVVQLLGIDMTYMVGDTYPLGAPFEHESITLGESLLTNPDTHEPLYSKGYGVYHKGCGFDEMVFTGHDEFMYMALKESEHKLPEWASYVVRFHSFYPWHNKGAYAKYASHNDWKNLKYLKEFNKCDLYLKGAEPITEEQRKVIDKVIQDYFPNGIMFPDLKIS